MIDSKSFLPQRISDKEVKKELPTTGKKRQRCEKRAARDWRDEFQRRSVVFEEFKNSYNPVKPPVD
jgi:hypothetical protein